MSVQLPDVQRTLDLSVPRWFQRVVAATVVALITYPVVVGGTGNAFDLLGVGWSTEFGVAAGLCAVGVVAVRGAPRRERRHYQERALEGLRKRDE